MPEEINAQIDAVIKELYAKRNQIDISINTMLLLKGSGSLVIPESLGEGIVQPASNGGGIASDAFFGMSLVDAAKKCIELKRARLTLAQIVTGLEQGGLPGQKPNTVYAALRRRESVDGDITRVDDLWGLKEWSAGISVKSTSKAAKGKKGKKKGAKRAAKKATKAASTETAKPKLVVVKEAPLEESSSQAKAGKSTTIRDATYEVLSKEGAPLHAELLAERINKDYGKTTNQKALAASLKDDGEQRFENIGHNTWALHEWPEEKKRLKVASATA